MPKSSSLKRDRSAAAPGVVEPGVIATLRALNSAACTLRDLTVTPGSGWVGVWGLGVGVWGLGFGVWGLGFGEQRGAREVEALYKYNPSTIQVKTKYEPESTPSRYDGA